MRRQVESGREVGRTRRQVTGRLDGWEQSPLEGAGGKIAARAPAWGGDPGSRERGTRSTRGTPSVAGGRTAVTRVAADGGRGGPRASPSQAPGGEGRSPSRRRGSPGLSGHGPLRRAGGHRADPRGQEQRRPRRRRVPGPAPARARYLGARRCSAAGDCGRRRGAEGGRGGRGPGRRPGSPGGAARGRRARRSRWRFQERAVPRAAEPAPRPAPRWAGTAEPPPRLARGPPHPQVAAPASASSTPHTPLRPSRGGGAGGTQRRGCGRGYLGLLPNGGLPTRSGGRRASRGSPLGATGELACPPVCTHTHMCTYVRIE